MSVQKATEPSGDPALKRSFKGHKEQVCKVAFNPNLKQVVSGSNDGTVMVWNFKSTMRPFRFVGHKGPVYDVKVNPQGNMIASCSADHTVRLWNNTVEGHSQVIKSHSGPVRAISLSSNGQLLLSGSDDKMLKIFQTSDLKFLYSIQAHNHWIKSCEFSPDTRLIASGSEDRTVKLWDFASRQMINTFVDHEAGVNSVKFHPDGTCVASGSQDKSIKIWDIRSQRLIQHYDAHSAEVNEIGFHPNGRYLLSSSNDSTLKIWDLRQGHILYTLYGHEGASTSAAFSPCGDYFTTGGQDSVVMVWKSNLEEIEQEFIEDFGAKMQPGEQPGVPKAKPPTKKPATGAKKNTSAITKRTSSPEKSQYGAAADMNYNYPVGQEPGDGVGGSGEELAQTLEKVVSQLDIISRTLHVLEQRVSMNEESVGNVMSYFNELKAQKANQQSAALGGFRQTNMGYNDTQGQVINVNPGDKSAKSGLSFNQNILNEQMLLAQKQGSMMGFSGLREEGAAGSGEGSNRQFFSSGAQQLQQTVERPDLDDEEDKPGMLLDEEYRQTNQMVNQMSSEDINARD